MDKKGSWVQLKQPSLNTFILSFHANSIIIGLSSAVLKGMFSSSSLWGWETTNFPLLTALPQEAMKCSSICADSSSETILTSFYSVFVPFFSSSLLFFSSLGTRGLLSFWHYDRCSLIQFPLSGNWCMWKWLREERLIMCGMGWVGEERAIKIVILLWDKLFLYIF